MFSLLHEIHFWSQKDGIFIDDLDFGAFMYCEKKNAVRCLLLEGKKSYSVTRGINWSLSNKRPRKLKDSLREFEEAFFNNRVLSFRWRNRHNLHVLYSNGLQTYLQVNPATGDLVDIVHDKFMIGKLSSQYVSDVIVSSSHAIFAYTDNLVTLVYCTKPALKLNALKKWSHLDVKVQHVKLSGPTGRRLDKQLSFNTTCDKVLIWWKSGRDDVYPWSPVVRDEDRANVYVYSVNGTKLSLLCYSRTDYDPINIAFSRCEPNKINTIQQKVSSKGEVSVEWENSRVAWGGLDNNFALSLLLPTHLSVVALSPKEDKMFISCIDGSLLMADSYGNISNIVNASFIPSLAAWHPDGSLILVGNDRGQLQWFDSSLSSVMGQMMGNDSSPVTTMDVGTYFKHQPTLLSVHWNRNNPSDSNANEDDLVFLHFERGPVVIVRLVSFGDRKWTCDLLAAQYLGVGSYEKAVNLLYSLDWEQDSDVALSTLQSIVAYLLRSPLTPETENALEKALGSYHNPVRPVSEAVDAEVGDSVHDLTRRFFHHLLRYKVVEKAFRLAIDLNDYDLFMDIYSFCQRTKNNAMAEAALQKAEDCLSHSESGSSCDCSSSSCCTGSSSELEEPELSVVSGATASNRRPHQRLVTPPLPIIRTPLPMPRSKVKFAATISKTSDLYLNVPKMGPIESCPTEISPNEVGLPVTPYESLQASSRVFPTPKDRHKASYLTSHEDLYSTELLNASRNYYGKNSTSSPFLNSRDGSRSNTYSLDKTRRPISNEFLNGDRNYLPSLPIDLGQPFNHYESTGHRGLVKQSFTSKLTTPADRLGQHRSCPPDLLPKDSQLWLIDSSLSPSASGTGLSTEQTVQETEPRASTSPSDERPQAPGDNGNAAKQPFPTEASKYISSDTEPGKIKVVHFGLV